MCLLPTTLNSKRRGLGFGLLGSVLKRGYLGLRALTLAPYCGTFLKHLKTLYLPPSPHNIGNQTSSIMASARPAILGTLGIELKRDGLRLGF